MSYGEKAIQGSSAEIYLAQLTSLLDLCLKVSDSEVTSYHIEFCREEIQIMCFW